jgi:hypothetical protein
MIQVPSGQQVTRLPEVSEIDSTTTSSSSSVTSTGISSQEESSSNLAQAHSELQDHSDSHRASIVGACTPPQKSPSTTILVLKKCLELSFITMMNAAITIFGVGIGVGIILADSFRAQTTSTTTASNSHRNSASEALQPHRRSEATVAVSAATPTCRASIRRAVDRIQEAPPLNLATASQLPAQ